MKFFYENCTTMELVESVPNGFKHILQTESERLIRHHKIKKENSLPDGKQ